MSAEATDAFGRLYERGGWRFKSGQPRSGGGSTVGATNVTCAVLSLAVRAVAERRSPVRILDSPCGDFTWMPGCLRSIAAGMRKSSTIEYRGIDVVQPLVEQLNARQGNLLSIEASEFAMPHGVRLLPFMHVDAANVSAMSVFRHRVDIIVSKHMLIHIPNGHIDRVLQSWNSLGASMIVKDNTRISRRRNRDTPLVGGRDVDLHALPFDIGAPLCSEPDSGLCAAESKCYDDIEVLALPLQKWQCYQ